MPRRRGFELPSQIDGHDPLKVCLEIPNAPEYRRAFLGHLHELGNWLTWERGVIPGDTRAAEAAEYWNQFLLRSLILGCDETENCPDCEDNCISHPTSSPIIKYYPNNPFYPGDVPSGYDVNPLYLGKYSALPGVRDSDVICDIFTSLPDTLFDLPNLILNSGFPRFVINFEGSGTVEIHFVQVPLGGVALITSDSDPLQIDTVGTGTYDVDLGVDDILDLIFDDAAEQNLVNEFIYEKTFEDDGPHHIDVTFIPNLEIVGLGIPIPLISWGGGLRRVVLCGVEPVFNPPQLQVTEDCLLEWSTDGGVTFVPVPGSENLADCFGGGGGDVAINLQVGAVDFFLRNSCPAGYLDFDDTERSKADYEELWAVLPSTFKDEINETFTLPSLVGRSLVVSGAGYDIGAFGGAKERRILPRNLPRVSPTYSRYENLRTAQSGNDFSVWSGVSPVPTSPIGADVPFDIQSPYFALKACILAKPQDAVIGGGVDGIKGEDGASPEMRVIGDEIQWRQDDGDPDWTLLYRISELKGPKGDTGDQGPAGPPGATGNQGPAGPPGADADCEGCGEGVSEPPELDPPVPGDYPPESDLDCIAAVSIKEKFKRETDKMLADWDTGLTVGALVNIVVLVLASFLVPNPLTAFGALVFIVGLVGSLIQGSPASMLTDSEWDEFTCILYCNMDGNGQLTQGGFDTARNEVDSKLETGWQILFELMGIIGRVGINNTVHLEGITSADCSSCVCDEECPPVAMIWADVPKDPIYPAGWSEGTRTIYPTGTVGQYRDHNGNWRNQDNFDDIVLRYDFAPCYVADVEMRFRRNTSSTVVAILGIRPSGEEVIIVSDSFQPLENPLNGTLTGTANETLIAVIFVINGGDTEIKTSRINSTSGN